MDNQFRIFLFHGVIREHRHKVRNYTRKHLSVDDFSEFITRALLLYHPVTMDDVLRACTGEHDLPPQSFAVTFDDGFENNASIAAPILADLGVPATFFVSTGFVGTDERSWTDEIESVLEQDVPAEFLGVGPGIDGLYESVDEKQALMDEIRCIVKNDPMVDPYKYSETLIKGLGRGKGDFCPDLDAKLSWDQVRKLDQDSLFSVGGHGHSHRVLSYVTHNELVDEVSTSLALLETAIGHPVVHYSYPEGTAACYTPEVIRVLKSFGIRCCPTAIDGLNGFLADPFELKRVPVLGKE